MLRFGTSGLRGPASELDGPQASRYAVAFLRAARVGEGECLIGRDLRASSDSIFGHVAAGVAAAGLRPRDCGAIATPALALAAQTRGLPAIMVTGSHIPADRNGLKFYADGEITRGVEEEITSELESVGLEFSPAAAEPEPTARQDYLERYAGLLREDALEGRRIGVWQHSSVLRDDLVTLLGRFGAEVIQLGRVDAFMAVDTEAVGAEDAARIAAWVKEHGLSALVSADGDADRPLIADETGVLVRGDVIGVLTGRFLAADIVVTPVTSNSAIEGTKWFTRVYRTRVGSPYVLAQMGRAALSGRTVMGFEANGGVLLGSAVRHNRHALAALPTRDAVLAILSVLGLARDTGQSVGALVAGFPRRFTRSGRIADVPEARSTRFMGLLGPAFLADVGAVESESAIDGRRFALAGGDVVHYRPSGNAPELRVYVESASPERADALLGWAMQAARLALEA